MMLHMVRENRSSRFAPNTAPVVLTSRQYRRSTTAGQGERRRVSQMGMTRHNTGPLHQGVRLKGRGLYCVPLRIMASK